MKKLKLSVISTLVVSVLLLVSCGEGNKKNATSTTNEDTVVLNNYSCPMHPAITGKKEDKCTKCGMFLTKTPGISDSYSVEENNNASIDSVVYSCPMHPNEKGLAGDKCDKCTMKLVKSTVKISKKCNHKDGKTCAYCTDKKNKNKCNHKEGETCPHCKKKVDKLEK